MEFLKIIDQLKKDFENDHLVRENGTILLGPDTIPVCQHMLFKQLDKRYVEDFLIASYKNPFPKEYVDFLGHLNGANLCSVRLKMNGISFAHSMMVIFGLPNTSPFSRPQEMEEPFDVRIEDLARHEQLPNSWLKCGTYIKDYNFHTQNDIFIDVFSNRVYSCERFQKDITDSWDSLDKCLCSIYDSLSTRKCEYVIG